VGLCPAHFCPTQSSEDGEAPHGSFAAAIMRVRQKSSISCRSSSGSD
jgi:hypothetical protein